MEPFRLLFNRTKLFQGSIRIIFVLLMVLSGCKKDPAPESITGVWNLDKLKVNEIFVNPNTTSDVMVQIVLDPDFSGTYTWADDGVINFSETFSWNTDDDLLTLTIGGEDPYIDEYLYFLEEDKLHIKYSQYECIFIRLDL
mgnify:CR=1 FL=1